MSIKPPVICACVLAAAAATPIPLFAGSSGYGYSQYSDTAAQGVADRTIARKQEDVRRAKAAIDSGDAAMKQRDYETAFAQFKAACDLIPESDVTHKLRREALNDLCDAACALAEQRISEGRYEDAQNLCKAVLDDRYDPDCHRAIVMLAHLEDPDYYNKTITPRFRGNVEEVKNLFDEAKGYEMSGRYDKAYQDYDKILNLDPYNVAARKGQEEVNAYRDNYSNQGYEETRSELLWELDNGWQMPVHKFGVKGTENFNPTVTDVRHTEYITNKLNRIVIPKIEFRDATVREAVDFLKEKSRDLDTQEPDPTRRGVNIVLQLDSGEASAPPAEAAPVAPAAPAIPGLEAAPAAGLPAAAAPAAAVPAVSSAEARITLSLSNIPLIEALKYICQLANLKLKIDPYAVSIVPPSVNTDELITKEYKVPAGFMSTAPTISGASSLSAPAARAGGGGGETAGVDSSGAGGQIANHQSAMDYLTSQGVQFPPGSNAVYFPASSRLIVHNTASNIELIDAIVESSQPAVPTQVSIEAKFVEIQQQNEKELSGSVLVGEFNLPGQHSIFAAGGTTGNGSPLNASDYPLPFATSGPLQEQPLTAGLRSGSYAISADAIDALLFPSTNGSAAAPAIFGIGSIMSDPSFQAVLRGLDQKKGIDLLDAPRVTTKSGQRAVIEIVREFRYPTEFDPPQIPQNFGSSGSGVLGATSTIAVFPVTPTTPTAFETRNTGVTLEVEPTVGSDNYTIDLNLVPQVVEFEGFINYGSPISTINPASLGLGGATAAITNAPTSVVLTPNVINQPIFSTRKVTTEVTVWDGQTVVLGGLMEDDVQKVQDKVPILGDIPLLGRAFRSNVDQHLKTNLVIFVTTHLINPAGDNILDLEEKDETVEPLPLPSAPVQPAPEAPLFQK
jgi:general secretion pathway protein D